MLSESLQHSSRSRGGAVAWIADVAEKLQMLLGRCDEKAALIVRKNTMFSMVRPRVARYSSVVSRDSCRP